MYENRNSRLWVKTLLDDLRNGPDILISKAQKVDNYGEKDHFSRLGIVNQALLCRSLLTSQSFEKSSTAAEGQRAT